MSDYTPTTDDVRDLVKHLGIEWSMDAADFDRWKAANDAAVLREAADFLDEFTGEDGTLYREFDDGSGENLSPADALRSKAAEKEGTA
ncbi:hypothetical protein [Microbacterium sp. zg-YB36]|uniref:hypothetical protein n=1 Tax=Microbacterium sp. zg-YB36 TaxID=2969407 RepID=UPI00214B21D0|nr:hypothetical protein [Microbacterium sp. zg-YB36]MDL5351174.1 hypothetical protein [Microbacterium sp. zg-YB36]